MFPGVNIVDWIYGDYRDDSAEVIEAQNSHKGFDNWKRCFIEIVWS